MNRSAVPGLALLLTTVSLAASAQVGPDANNFVFRPGERIVFLGDSITDQYHYSSYIELYLTTRFPTGNMIFYNAGIGGNKAIDGLRRFDSHVLAEKPTCVVINFGMNDGGYRDFNPQEAETFVKSTEAMLEAAKKAGVRAVLVSPNAVEVRNRLNLRGYLATQERFYAPLKELATKHGIAFVDQYVVTRRVLEALAVNNAPVRAFPDGVHTSPAGGVLMAHTILTRLKAPEAVSGVMIDVLSGQAKVTGCTVANVNSGPDRLTFERTDAALPLPVLKEWREMLPYVERLKDLNDYGLKVLGLKRGQYTLRIDGDEVATLTAEELATGVNLGNLDRGPLYEQGMRVWNAIEAKNRLVRLRFGVQLYQLPPWLTTPAATAALEEARPHELAKRAEQIAARQAEVYKLAQPTPHRFDLSAVK